MTADGVVAEVTITIGGADVSDRWRSIVVTNGTDAFAAPSHPIRFQSARGAAILDDRDGDLLALRGGRCVILAGGTFVWEGLARRDDPAQLGTLDTARFSLAGRWARRLSEGAELWSLLPGGAGGTAADLIAAAREAMGLGAVWLSHPEFANERGRVEHVDWVPSDGSWADLWSAVGRYVGGFATENRIGQVVIARPDPSTLDAAVELGAAYGALRGSILFPRPQMSVAYAAAAAAGRDIDPDTLLAEVDLTIGASGQAIFEHRNRRAGSVIQTWLTPTAAGVTFDELSTTAHVGRWAAAGPAGVHTVTLRGARAWPTTTELVTTGDLLAALAEPTRTLEIPQWARAPLDDPPDGIALAASLAGEPLWLHGRWPLSQATQSMNDDLLEVDAGDAAAVTVGDNDATTMILGRRFAAHRGRVPTIDLVGIGLTGIAAPTKPPDVAPRPTLPVVTVVGVDDNQLRIELPAGNLGCRARWRPLVGRLIVAGATTLWRTSAWQPPGTATITTPPTGAGAWLVQTQCRLADGTPGVWSPSTLIAVGDIARPAAPLIVLINGEAAAVKPVNCTEWRWRYRRTLYSIHQDPAETIVGPWTTDATSVLTGAASSGTVIVAVECRNPTTLAESGWSSDTWYTYGTLAPAPPAPPDPIVGVYPLIWNAGGGAGWGFFNPPGPRENVPVTWSHLAATINTGSYNVRNDRIQVRGTTCDGAAISWRELVPSTFVWFDGESCSGLPAVLLMAAFNTEEEAVGAPLDGLVELSVMETFLITETRLVTEHGGVVANTTMLWSPALTLWESPTRFGVPVGQSNWLRVDVP